MEFLQRTYILEPKHMGDSEPREPQNTRESEHQWQAGLINPFTIV